MLAAIPKPGAVAFAKGIECAIHAYRRGVHEAAGATPDTDGEFPDELSRPIAPIRVSPRHPPTAHPMPLLPRRED